MNDEQIYQRGGSEEDIKSYAESNGADLTKEDFTQQNPTLEGWEINLGELVGALMASQGHTKPLHNLELFTKYSKEIVDYVSTLITAAKEEGEQAAYERVIEEIPTEIDFKDAEGGCPIELTVKCHIKQQLIAKFLNQGEET